MMAGPTALLVSRDPSLTDAVRGVVDSTDGFILEVVDGIEQACRRVADDGVLIVLFHLVEGSCVSGVIRLLQTIAINNRSVVTLVLSDNYRAEQGSVLLRLGASDYLPRPLDLSRLAYLIDFLTISARHGAQKPSSRSTKVAETVCLTGPGGNFFFYLESTKMGLMVEQVRRIAPLSTTILLGGETGTGKSVLAGVIHQLSPRRDQPLSVVNCAALSSTLFESELFGHKHGAFTGADADRVGKFAEVGRGTLFLDEIDSLSLPLQAKLLRVVENRVFEPVGSNRTEPMRARLIVASNRPLEREVAAGRFRADLFYRLNVVAFELPPLRERTSIIPILTTGFLNEFAAATGRSVHGVSPEALKVLLAHHWPGNLRELRNVIERAVALCEGPVVELHDLPESLQRPASVATPSPAFTPASHPASMPDGTGLAVSRAVAERGLIVEALLRNGGNRLRSAAELGISRMTLYNKISKHHIQ